MKLFFHEPNSASGLLDAYREALENGEEIIIVSAYLTAWNPACNISKKCKHFRMIIGSDFGITKKAACRAVINWLPSGKRKHFLVADDISGFHPKAVFWKTHKGVCYSIIGSSNLTQAAFEKNFEVNLKCRIGEEDFDEAKAWADRVANASTVVDDDWLARYVEAKSPPKKGKTGGAEPPPPSPTVSRLIKNRRLALKSYREHRQGLHGLFHKCAVGKVSSREFYERLGDYWGYETGCRLQGAGWERLGKDSDFRKLAESYVRILYCKASQRDVVVAREMDRLHNAGVPTRKAFLTEMLCLEFPHLYPVLNSPIRLFLRDDNFSHQRGSTEGEIYIQMAKRLRRIVLLNLDHPVKNLAELDTVIWSKYAKNKQAT